MAVSAIGQSVIDEAVLVLPKNFVPRHEHSKRCYNVLKHILHPNEYTVIEAKQSLWKSLAPGRLVATNQRIIVVKPSFWALWAGRNIFSPTEYESIPYANVINITLYTGMLFSSLYIHLSIGSSNGEGDIDGLKTEDAHAMFPFLEKMTELLIKQQHVPANENIEVNGTDANMPHNKRDSNYIDLETSRKLVRYRGSKFIWLGAEPLEFVADKLDVDRSAIVKISSDELIRMNAQESVRLNECILVCYNDMFSSYMSKFLKHSHGVETYVLTGGIGYQAQKILELKNLNLKSSNIV